MTPSKPTRACPVCRRKNCTDPNHPLEKDREERARQQWVRAYGWVCPGVSGERERHDVSRGQLTAVRANTTFLQYAVVCKACKKRLLERLSGPHSIGIA
jgi:hypothetical protein